MAAPATPDRPGEAPTQPLLSSPAWKSDPHELETEAALSLAQRAIFAATYRDAYSGGTVRVYHIDKDGWTRVSETDSMELYFKFRDEKEKMDKASTK